MMKREPATSAPASKSKRSANEAHTMWVTTHAVHAVHSEGINVGSIMWAGFAGAGCSGALDGAC
jgi:hypothetical protein